MLKAMDQLDHVTLITLCAFGAETRFSVTAESNEMLYIPLQRNIM